MDIRRANLEDASLIAALKSLVWQNDPGNPALIGSALTDASHASSLAVVDGQVVGFIDGFLTHSMEGELRWEVDLLAVHPDYRGIGLATALVQANVEDGVRRGAVFARSLIQVNNVASQRAFIRRNFQPDETICNLHVCAQGSGDQSEPSERPFLVKVQTFSYRGLWMESAFYEDSFAWALAKRLAEGWDIVGAVIPVEQAMWNRAAQVSGFTLVSIYQWWRLIL